MSESPLRLRSVTPSINASELDLDATTQNLNDSSPSDYPESRGTSGEDTSVHGDGWKLGTEAPGNNSVGKNL